MTMTDFTTVENVRKTAEADYERDHPRPQPPEPVGVSRPVVIQIGDNAHLWIDIAANQASYGRRASVNANLFLVEREHGKDQRMEGSVAPENIDVLIQELLRVRDELTSRQAFIGANGAYEKQIEEWDRAKAEFARRQVATWEKAQGNRK